MTIQDLGSIGELIAAIATVATLVYLAIQIRANTIVTRAEARRATRPASSATNLAVVNNGEVARIFRIGHADVSKLDADEWVRFSFLMGELIGNFGEAYREVSAGILPEKDFENQIILVAQFLTTPGGQRFWQQFGPSFPKDFREFVDHSVIATAVGEK